MIKMSIHLASKFSCHAFLCLWLYIAALAFFGTLHAQTFESGTWQRFGGIANGCNGPVSAQLRLSNGDLIVGGNFSACGDAAANNIARWDGTQWHSLGTGVNSGVVSLASDGTTIYVGGLFMRFAGGVPANNIAAFRNGSWEALGSGTLGAVYALAWYDARLYIGGSFNLIGGVSANSLATWNGSAFEKVGVGTDNGVLNTLPFGSSPPRVQALHVAGNKLYVGGRFTLAGAVQARNIAQWDPQGWQSLGFGLGSFPLADNDNEVNAIASAGANVYAAGNFSSAYLTSSSSSAISASRIATWDGANWQALGTGLDNVAYSLAADQDAIYAGGAFRTAGGLTSSGIAKFQAGSWQAVAAGGIGGSVNSVLAGANSLTIGGSFIADGNQMSNANNVAELNNGVFSALGQGNGLGANGPIKASVFFDGSLYVGGSFTQIGSIAANRIARWDGTQWYSVGTGSENGLNGGVAALYVHANRLYVGGGFSQAGSVLTRNIASFQAGVWTGLQNGVGDPIVGATGDGSVSAITSIGADLYVAGSFRRLKPANGDAVTVNSIARWDGSQWHALVDGESVGINNDSTQSVRAMAAIGTELYAAGLFTSAGGRAAPYIARWDGIRWFALGSGLNSFAYALAPLDGGVWVGGSFTQAGTITANRIAYWKNGAWQTAANGANSSVVALASTNGKLYAAGGYTSIGGLAAQGLAVWNGVSWKTLGTGVGPERGRIDSLCVGHAGLYATGTFLRIDNLPSTAIAQWLPALDDQIFGSGFE